MLQLTQIKSNKAEVIKGLEKKRFSDAEATISQVIELDDNRKAIQSDLDSLLNELNQISRSIGSLLKEGKKEEAELAKQTTRELKEKSKGLSEKMADVQDQLEDLLYSIPNIPHPDVPEGVKPEDNLTLFEWGDIPVLGDDALPHWDLIQKYDIIDFKLGNKITGAGFPVYKGKGAKLQRALVSFFLEEAEKAGYMEIQPPVLINAESGHATGQLPDKEGQMYQLTDEEYYLIPTAEVPITNIYRDSIIGNEELPIKNVGYTTCFRREAGSWGAHVRGLNRLHQFDKVEIVEIHKPDESYKALDKMCDYVKSLLVKLELPFRMIRLCGGDLGFTSAMTYDMEVFSAGQQKWLEVSSVSNFETYQANRLKLRYKDDNGKNVLLHTLNGSALALPRIVAAILENNQSEDGIRIPEVLVKYTGFKVIK
ncbi:MAG: serine--tRNA ligase [Cyclobacteriaceae bacterium]|jgi:seryl-tRNA synthetase